ncbi:class II aaRS and biotin synthetase [Neocallimastix lanati (nom. inval.)]|jgi:biotin--protein ligase|uniref:Class II aaRS and biotin synthetase n=1 Tax=Neocallimastix californiae TaxID=1754190 RepID=A0A1Y2ECV8_9FUNG|nr:class II aaRS and biotin synthetase [Neocallimastix sp. JGI-2020a]ORY69247.1 class II aaRS and biotin synthetase [Neocallimastix californiae]|eukprot:ORY69247.1 class II aaRS and biotin synthetase [Neocallimastix californiae]
MNVLVYSGEGASQDSVDYTIYTLKQFISENYDIIKVDDKILITQYWEDSTKLLVIPGGRDLPYVNKLGSKGMERIRKYVNDRGGKYLGIGAGAYFGASNIEFEMNRPDYKVEGQRELKFFNGTAKGSAMNPFYYDSEESALSPKIHLPLLNKDVNLYLNGGCFFDINEKEKVSNELNILGTYTTKCFDGTDNRPAIIEVKNGKGKAILSGVHFEYSPELMIEKKKKAQEEGKDISNLEKVIEDIEKTNMDRIEFIKSIFERLDLKLNKDIKNSITEEKNNYHLLLIGMEGQSNKKFIDNILESDINENSLNENYFSFKENVEEKDKEVIYINKFENENQLKNFKYFNVKYYLEKLKNNYCNYNENELNEKYLPGSITLYSEILSSTQTILKNNKALLGKLPHGAVAIASKQCSGRGRNKNSWISSPGALQFTVTLHHKDISTISSIQFLIGICIANAIKSFDIFKNVNVHLKWPNDIYLKITENGEESLKKIGGILSESVYVNNNYTMLLGCGINVHDPCPTMSLEKAYKLANNQDLNISTIKEDLLAKIMSNLDSYYEKFKKTGLKPFIDEYYQFWLHTNSIVKVEGLDAKIIGIDDYGCLRVLLLDEEHKNEEKTLLPDGNSFDMLKGLIFSK